MDTGARLVAELHSGAAATAFLVMAAVAPFAGRFVDRHGVRLTLGLGLALVGGGCLLVSATSNALVFLIAFGGLAAIGFGIVATHVVSTAIARRSAPIGGCDRHRDLGGNRRAIPDLPLVAVVLATFSWRWSFLAIGIGCFAAHPAAVVDARGEGAIRSAPDRSHAAPPCRCLSIIRKPAFHILFWSFLLCGYTTAGVIETHFLPYASFCGFGPAPSAAAYGMLSAVNMLGMIAAGWLTDRMNRVVLLGSIYLLEG